MTATSMEVNNTLMQLEERAKKLAMEKAHLNLLIHMMSQLSTATGLENAVANLLQVILKNIGGVNLTLHYWIDDEVHYADVFGKKEKLDVIEDAYVAQVAKNRIFSEQEHDFQDTHMITLAFTKAQTWVIPLLVGIDLIGVLKIEGLHIGSEALKQHLPTFFNYLALLLKNEILGHTQLQKAYNQLLEAHAELTIEVTDRKRTEEALKQEHCRLQQALDEVKTLRGIMPICAYCKKIRDDEGYWNQVEKYVSDHTEAKFSHGICPACFEREMKEIETSDG
jgi:K+-sensing histidine kinase KdpD